MIQIPIAVMLAIIIGALIPKHNHDPELQPYVEEFLTIVKKVCKPEQLNYSDGTKMSFVQKFDDPQEAAQCQRFDDGSWEIQVLQSEWDKITMDNRRLLVYHELSHCVLLKGHSPDPGNYMYPSIVDLTYDIVTDEVLGDAWTLCGKKSIEE